MKVARRGSGSATRQTQDFNYTFTPDPLTPEEQSVFASDLRSIGLDEEIWSVLNTVLETGTPASRPLVARAYAGDSLAGAAIFYECRKSGECFFDPPLSSLMDLPGMPMFFWLRYGATIDHCANPGFVADGIDRRAFVDGTIRALQGRYLLGSVVEYQASPHLEGAKVAPFVDIGVIDTEGMADISAYLAIGKNLSRKLKKFHNKGGEIRVIEGAMPPELRDAALDAFGTLSIMIRTPFQDNYLNMARTNMSIDSPGMIHIVALLDGTYAGHQSFCLSGDTLHCQAGAFDRRSKSTYHAYENIIVSSVEYARERGLRRIDYGPVLNETKKKMMTGFVPIGMRTYARYRPIAAGMPLMLNRSKISPERLKPWTSLGVGATTAFV